MSQGKWPEIRKLEISPSEFCPISRVWSKLGILGMTVSKLLNTAKCQVYSFHLSWVIKVKPTEAKPFCCICMHYS